MDVQREVCIGGCAEGGMYRWMCRRRYVYVDVQREVCIGGCVE